MRGAWLCFAVTKWRGEPARRDQRRHTCHMYLYLYVVALFCIGAVRRASRV